MLVLAIVLVLPIGTMLLLYNLLLHIILCVVVFLILTPIVGFYLFMAALVLVIILGSLVLLYYVTSYYPFRGGHSSAGTDCGVFYVLASLAVSVAYWHLGAALSCK
jgi:hypothetical protein